MALAVGFAGALAVAACAPDVYTRGALVKENALSKIKTGSTSQSQVFSLLGAPSTASLFDNGETWFYIGSKTTQRSYHAQEELERQVVAITFDKKGIVRSTDTLSKNDGQDIVMVERKTPTRGKSLSLMEQFIGNIGRFNNSPNTERGRP